MVAGGWEKVLYGRRASEAQATDRPIALGPCTITNDGNVQAASTGAVSIICSDCYLLGTRLQFTFAGSGMRLCYFYCAELKSVAVSPATARYRTPAFRYRRPLACMTQTVQAVHRGHLTPTPNFRPDF
jgi:hypothetical protein